MLTLSTHPPEEAVKICSFVSVFALTGNAIANESLGGKVEQLGVVLGLSWYIA